jgi:hypothetical protein
MMGLLKKGMDMKTWYQGLSRLAVATGEWKLHCTLVIGVLDMNGGDLKYKK